MYVGRPCSVQNLWYGKAVRGLPAFVVDLLSFLKRRDEAGVGRGYDFKCAVDLLADVLDRNYLAVAKC